jgi:hypothetical protein
MAAASTVAFCLILLIDQSFERGMGNLLLYVVNADVNFCFFIFIANISTIRDLDVKSVKSLPVGFKYRDGSPNCIIVGFCSRWLRYANWNIRMIASSVNSCQRFLPFLIALTYALLSRFISIDQLQSILLMPLANKHAQSIVSQVHKHALQMANVYNEYIHMFGMKAVTQSL